MKKPEVKNLVTLSLYVPLCLFLHPPPLKPTSCALVHKTNYAPMIYTALCMFWMHAIPCISNTRSSGRGLGPVNLEFFGPQIALAYQIDAISQGPKNSPFPGPSPLPLDLVLDMHAYKTLCTGLYKS
jgi:hypothetical protein